jgi:hypothetical protein
MATLQELLCIIRPTACQDLGRSNRASPAAAHRCDDNCLSQCAVLCCAVTPPPPPRHARCVTAGVLVQGQAGPCCCASSISRLIKPSTSACFSILTPPPPRMLCVSAKVPWQGQAAPRRCRQHQQTNEPVGIPPLPRCLLCVSAEVPRQGQAAPRRCRQQQAATQQRIPRQQTSRGRLPRQQQRQHWRRLRWFRGPVQEGFRGKGCRRNWRRRFGRRRWRQQRRWRRWWLELGGQR